MKHLFKYCILILIIFSTELFSQLKIAITDFTALGISENESRTLTDRFRYELINMRIFVVLEREKMNLILDEQGFQLSGCTDDKCIVEAGRLLAVEDIISGSISKIGSIYSVSVRLISIESGEIVSNVQKDFKENIEYLLTDGMSIIANDLASAIDIENFPRHITARMPLQDYKKLIFRINYISKSFSIPSWASSSGDMVPGIGIGCGYRINKNLFCLNFSHFIDYNLEKYEGGVWQDYDLESGITKEGNSYTT